MPPIFRQHPKPDRIVPEWKNLPPLRQAFSVIFDREWGIAEQDNNPGSQP